MTNQKFITEKEYNEAFRFSLKKQTASLGLIKWHDLKDNPEDLPFDNDKVIVTARYSGTNGVAVYSECYVEHTPNGEVHWFDGISDYPMDRFFDILAWAHYPNPYKPATDTSPKVEEAI